MHTQIIMPEKPSVVPGWAIPTALLLNVLVVLIMAPEIDLPSLRARYGSTAREYLQFAAMVSASFKNATVSARTSTGATIDRARVRSLPE